MYSWRVREMRSLAGFTSQPSKHMQSNPRAEIGGGLVVDGGGEARAWVRSWWPAPRPGRATRALPNCWARSQIAREAAHRFYLREGFARTKTSAVFTKHPDASSCRLSVAASRLLSLDLLLPERDDPRGAHPTSALAATDTRSTWPGL